MAILKCKMCGGELEKCSDMYYCKNCNTVFQSIDVNSSFESVDLSLDQIQKIDMLISRNEKMEAIKTFKDLTGCGLKEAKEFVDNYELQTGTTPIISNAVCKSCGGEIKKEGNVFVCQKCGEVFKDEYAVAHGNSAIKSKTPKINMNFSEEKTERLNNLYTIARRAKENDDSKQAEKYYDMILMENPNSWEAVFYATYFSVAQCKIGEIGAAADKLTNCLNSVFDLIDTYAVDSEESAAITEVYTKTKSFAELLFYNAKSHYSEFKDTSNPITEFYTRCNLIYLLLCELGDQLEKRYMPNHETEKMCVDAWKKGIEIRLNHRFWDEESKQKFRLYSDKVKKYDPSYQGVNPNSGGCYVATCVYGSYDCPEVWTLRRYRDYTLAETWYGRAFIKTYYAISPTIVKWFGNTDWFKKLWCEILDKMVDNLNDKGIENTPYNDRR